MKKKISLIEQRRKHRYDKNKSEYNRLRNLINRKLRKIKEKWLGQYCKEIKTSLIGEILKSHTILLESYLETPKQKNITIK